MRITKQDKIRLDDITQSLRLRDDHKAASCTTKFAIYYDEMETLRTELIETLKEMKLQDYHEVNIDLLMNILGTP